MVEPADGITNDADALVRLNDYIEHGPHTLNREQATAVFGIRTNSGVEIVDIDIPMAQGRAQTSPTGQWKIIDGLGRELFRFRPAFSNTRAIANELAALWARENNFDGNYQVEPAEDTAPALTPDQQQGGLIDVAGSTADLAQQRATPGTFTGAWKIIDNDGNEMHRFSGVGNNQRDANRVATQWIQNNGYAYGTEIEVVPIMSESIAEGFSNSPQTVTRIDSKPITDFVSSLKAYKHTDDWSQSGVDTGDDSYWKKKNLKTNTTKGLFAGDPHRTALYATGNAHETRYVEFTQNGQPVVYFDQKDLPAMRSRKTYLTVFDAANFKKLPTGEYFSENPGQPLTQTEISDPFQYIASQGWIVRVTPDLNKVFKQVQYMHQNRKIQQYGAEGMSESIAEGADKKYTIKKSYTMSKAGVEKSVWHIMDGDFVVDVTDLRRDAKYYADKWNAAEKESSNASQNLHKQDVTEGLLKEFAPGEGGFGPFKVYISNEFIEEFPTFDQAKEEIDFLRTADPKSFDADWKIIDGTGKTVWQHDPGEAIDAMRMRRKIQFNKPDNNGVAEGKDFDRCFDQACKLYDQAVNKNLKPKLVQVADFQGDGNGADARWMKLPQHVWQHYVVIVGDQVLDPTAKQFGDSMPTQYQVSDLDRLWGKQYQIRPRQGVAEGAEEINWIKPNFDYEWDEIEFQSKQPQVPADVRRCDS